jgi:hypothetical protein
MLIFILSMRGYGYEIDRLGVMRSKSVTGSISEKPYKNRRSSGPAFFGVTLLLFL